MQDEKDVHFKTVGGRSTSVVNSTRLRKLEIVEYERGLRAFLSRIFLPILSAYFWYVLPSEPDGRTYQISNIDLLLTECKIGVAIFVEPHINGRARNCMRRHAK